MQITMPKLGLTMTEGTIVEWLKAPGDAVKDGEVLFNYETEKVTLDYEAPGGGVLVAIVATAGTTVPAGGVVCEYQTVAEMAAPAPRAQASSAAGGQPASAPAGQAGVAPVATKAMPPAPAGRVEATPKARRLAAEWGMPLAGLAGRGPNGRVQAVDVEQAHAAALAAVTAAREPPVPAVKATPVARRVAEAEGVDLSRVQGSGPGGQITRDDVARAAVLPVSAPEPVASVQVPLVATPAAPAVTQAETVIPLRSIRGVIAQRMAESAFTAPHVTLFTEAEATLLVAARAQLNQDLPAEDKLSYNALLAAIVARGLREHPMLNSRLEPDGIHLLREINLALAVDTDRGLLTPVLPGVDRLGLLAIQRGFAALVRRASSGTSLSEDFAGGTFTITNLGGLDVDGFTPIINPPQAAILGVGRIVEKPVVRDGAVVARPMVILSLSFDHRIVDGGPAARFLQRIKQLVEKPLALLL
jgi:pyruvate dehydrogenase E2 component (dihydrolipoamide acetyltransferase)